MSIGIHNLRELLNARQKDLATFLLVSKSALTHFELGSRNFTRETLTRLEKLFVNVEETLQKVELEKSSDLLPEPELLLSINREHERKKNLRLKLIREFELIEFKLLQARNALRILVYISPVDPEVDGKIQESVIMLLRAYNQRIVTKLKMKKYIKLRMRIAGLEGEMKILADYLN